MVEAEHSAEALTTYDAAAGGCFVVHWSALERSACRALRNPAWFQRVSELAQHGIEYGGIVPVTGEWPR